MRVLHILPGSGGSFYCQNCLRDLALSDALRRRGHEVTLMPLYLPATAWTPEPSEVPVFYGAITLFLRHKYAFLRRLPRAWFAPLDAWPVLRFVARFAGATSASGLEDLTLSMLRGTDGRQADELRLVAEWVAGLPQASRPEVIVLSNALLAGLAKPLKQAAGCPVVCWLQDEHVWTDAMAPDLRDAVMRAMAAQAREADRFVAVSAAYAARLTPLLGLDPARVSVVYPGIDPAAYRPADMGKRPPVIGFLSRLSAEEGFDRFVDAFLLLRRDPRFADARLSATGGPSPDKRFLKRQLKKLSDAGCAPAAAVSVDRFAQDRFGFLSELTLLSVPGGRPEAFGYYAIEAMAAGVPVVLPAQGAFPEIAAAAGCGTLVADTEPATLARAWADLLSDPDRLQREAAQGRAAAATVFSQAAAATALEAVLTSVRAAGPGGRLGDSAPANGG
jgi:glycosyltransferase involved in cell wall biosynthesis